MIKPVAYMIDEIGVVTKLDFERRQLLKHIQSYKAVPLYAIPEGYHIVAINKDQAIKDSLEQHNDNLRMDDE